MREVKTLVCTKCGEPDTAEMDYEQGGWWFLDDDDAECSECGGEMELDD